MSQARSQARDSAALTAVVILSMALTPLVVILLDRLMPPPKVSMDGVEVAANLRGRVLMIGFGRFAQVVSQPLLARGMEVSLIENDVDMIRAAGTFGFKVYYGDGSRLDVLRASGAANAEAILVCVDKPEVADRIVEMVRDEFPLAKIFARAFDRRALVKLRDAPIDGIFREVLESAVAMARAALESLDVAAEEIDRAEDYYRSRDRERLTAQKEAGEVRAVTDGVITQNPRRTGRGGLAETDCG